MSNKINCPKEQSFRRNENEFCLQFDYMTGKCVDYAQCQQCCDKLIKLGLMKDWRERLPEATK